MLYKILIFKQGSSLIEGFKGFRYTDRMHFDSHPERPLIVQGDGSLLLETHHPLFDAARARLSAFAELEKSPEHIHTYRLSPISLWNAASAGLSPEAIIQVLKEFSRYELPANIIRQTEETLSRWGMIVMEAGENEKELILRVLNPALRREVLTRKSIVKYLVPSGENFTLELVNRGTIKAELIRLGWPVEDRAPLREGAPLVIEKKFTPRDYQNESASALLGDNGPGTGFGVIVLPCGSGKTVVGLEILSRLQTHTLILTTNVAAVHQWIDEIKSKTGLTADQIGEYTGDLKLVRPITVATYQVLVWRPDKVGDFPHFSLLRNNPWGLIIYDEVHLLPAPVFRVAAEVQAVRRVGLTATLVREDGAEGDVFSLVGPKKYDKPWKELEAKGWIAEAVCREIRLDFARDQRMEYAVATKRDQFRIASVNPLKLKVIQQLIELHPEDQILIIGQYVDQLQEIAEALGSPLITGKTPHPERERIYKSFKDKEVRIITVSKVANFAIDLPDASMAIQISGTFGSRQEEAQRLGRILRPKARNSYFYTVVTRYTLEEEYAQLRQRFLAEQGYKYSIELWEDDLG